MRPSGPLLVMFGPVSATAQLAGIEERPRRWIGNWGIGPARPIRGGLVAFGLLLAAAEGGKLAEA